jgi:hypothetical protein
MSSNKRDLSIPWPFAPAKVDLNTDTNLLKIVAMIAMFIDHAGKMLFPEYRIMRVIGRIAFPIYAYCIAVGSVYTKDPLRYLSRIVFLALISQPLYAIALNHESQLMYMYSFADQPARAALNFYLHSWTKPSILVTLAIGIILIWTVRERRMILTLAMAVLCWKIQGSLDYGLRGIILMVLFYLFSFNRIISFPVVFCYMLWWAMQGSGYTLFGVQFGIQIFAMLSLVLIYVRTQSGVRLNKWVFYLFYPVHLIAIMLLTRFAV